MMDKEYLIKNELRRVGCSARLADGSWRSMPFYCSVQPTWLKNKADFESELTPVGVACTNYYLYTGPFDHDITALSDEAVLEYDGCCYEFKKREKITFENRALYYSAVLSKLYGENSDD